MKKKILLFEPDELLRNTLLEQISLNKDFEVTGVSSFEDVRNQLNKSTFDLIIMGTDRKAYFLLIFELQLNYMQPKLNNLEYPCFVIV